MQLSVCITACIWLKSIIYIYVKIKINSLTFINNIDIYKKRVKTKIIINSNCNKYIKYEGGICSPPF